MPNAEGQNKKAAVVATGWVGDSIMCSAAAQSLHEDKGYQVDFFIKWPQLMRIMEADDRFITRLYQDNFLGRLKLKLRLQWWNRSRGYAPADATQKAYWRVQRLAHEFQCCRELKSFRYPAHVSMNVPSQFQFQKRLDSACVEDRICEVCPWLTTSLLKRWSSQVVTWGNCLYKQWI